MTKKQALIARLNELKSNVGEPPLSEGWIKRAKTWTVEELVKIYERNAA